jgi:hypothetical protein
LAHVEKSMVSPHFPKPLSTQNPELRTQNSRVAGRVVFGDSANP